jgi:hypothetical protein
MERVHRPTRVRSGAYGLLAGVPSAAGGGENGNDEELDDPGPTAQEERALVAFLRTLSDGWR